MYRIFIVEDDEVIASRIAEHLVSWGLRARTVTDFSRVIDEFREFDPHLVLMDITLPFFNGYHWCREIRRDSRVPVIFISSASDNMNVVMAVNMGGDDFVAKPFDLDVLTAKITAMLRRTYDFAAPAPVTEVRGAVLDTAGAALVWQDKRIELTKNENRILQVLMENAGRVVARDRLMTKLWETDSFIDDNTLTVNMTRLRRKLDDAGLHDFIATRKGMGYSVSESGEDGR